MNYAVYYSPLAEQDLIEILAYGIEIWGEKLAENMYIKIIKYFQINTKDQTLGIELTDLRDQ